jgi:purine-cytosine permease-like protein
MSVPPPATTGPAADAGTGAVPAGSALTVEAAGVDIIADRDRKGTPRQLFWPWFAANVSVLGLSYGAWVLDFGVSFTQALVASVVGIVFSFLLCGFVALAGKRGSAPTMVLSRAALGVQGNRVAAVLSWLLTVGWETILTALATLATATVVEALGWGGGSGVQVVALVVVAGLIIAGGVFGFDLIMRMQTVITVVTAVLTVGYVLLVLDHIDTAAVTALPAGTAQAFIGALVFMMTGFGLGWVNMAADYSRYLPRHTSGAGVVGWTTFGASLAPVILLLGGAVLDIYSSGLALVSTGLPVSRPVAAGIDGVIMVLGTIYIVFGSDTFFGVFQGFLITLGVPIAAWAGIMLADVLLRRRDYDDLDLYRPTGRYGRAPAVPLTLLALGTVLGWGLVTNASAGWLAWQGYLLGAVGLGGKDGAWAYANLGVLVALVVGFGGTLLLRRGAVRRQEALPPSADAGAAGSARAAR